MLPWTCAAAARIIFAHDDGAAAHCLLKLCSAAANVAFALARVIQSNAVYGVQVNYLPLLHIPGILGLQRRFHQGAGRPTASSKSPAATPCLAIYTAAGKPLW